MLPQESEVLLAFLFAAKACSHNVYDELGFCGERARTSTLSCGLFFYIKAKKKALTGPKKHETKWFIHSHTKAMLQHMANFCCGTFFHSFDGEAFAIPFI